MENEAILNEVQADGSTKRKHLESIEKQTGKRPQELKTVELPIAGLLIIDYFSKLDGCRRYSSEGYPRPFSHQDINSWCQLTQTNLTDFELYAIKLLDSTQINTLYKNKHKG